VNVVEVEGEHVLGVYCDLEATDGQDGLGLWGQTMVTVEPCRPGRKGGELRLPSSL
jgi:hypothetical protein